MCGIAGILKTDAKAVELTGPLERMQSALRHRGPDDRGLFISKSGGAGLAHTRLSILDLSPAGHQPMTTPDGRFTIVFNGEIYNFQKFRDRLAKDGVVFRSHSDTEVLLHLYERKGAACVDGLRGMFAFAVWDDVEQSCFLARDPLGIKPLYYAHSPARLVFASELRAVLASGLVEKRLNPSGLFGYFQTGTVPEPETLVCDVRCLEAGATLFWKAGELTRRQYWSLEFSSEGDGDDAVSGVREALLDSVRHHFVSDVPVGVFLSGGIDSTAIVALSRAVGQQDLRTFSISFDDPKFDEGDVSRRTSERFATRHADWRLQPAAGKKLFDEFLACLDQPSIDGFNTFTVSRFAHDQGMKVVLSGLGGDELFGGYPSFHQLPRMVRWSRGLGMMPPLRSLAGKILGGNRRPQWRRLGSFLCQPPTLFEAYRTYRGVYSRAEGRTLAAHYAQVEPPAVGESILRPAGQRTAEDEVSALELQLYMRNQLLRDSDVMSMAWGLELRVPFVDVALLENVARVPASLRLRAGKKMLLEAVPEVPDWVWNRPKRGFLFPFEQWLAGDWKELFDSAVKRSPIRAQTWDQKWSLFVFERWCASTGVKIA
jgi:asparagine synthase (glutamine-hydrolysing)